MGVRLRGGWLLFDCVGGGGGGKREEGFVRAWVSVYGGEASRYEGGPGLDICMACVKNERSSMHHSAS